MGKNNEIRNGRDKKGESLLAFPEKYILLDIETTGLSPAFDEIIEISALKIEKGEIKQEFSQLIKPTYEISEFITKLTGITNEMVEDAKSIKEVLKEFKDFFTKEDIVVGYNVNFDINFLYDNFQEHLNDYFENNFVDVMRIAKRVFKNEIESFRLKRLAEHFNISTKGIHRGLTDCNITWKIFKKTEEEMLNKFETLEKFLENKRKESCWSAKDTSASNNNFDIENPCYGKQFVFTGTLKMSRKEAMQLVVDFGGKVKDGVTKDVNFLVMGTMDYSRTITGEKSSKMIKAESLKLKGQDIEIIPEDVFLEMFPKLEKKMSKIKYEKNSYNKAKAFLILLSHRHTVEEIQEELGHHILHEFTPEEKQKMFEECIEEELISLEDIEKTKCNFFNKLKVLELLEILEKNKIEASERTKKPLIEKILKYADLTKYDFKPVYIWSKKGEEFRELMK